MQVSSLWQRCANPAATRPPQLSCRICNLRDQNLRATMPQNNKQHRIAGNNDENFILGEHYAALFNQQFVNGHLPAALNATAGEHIIAELV